MYIWDSVAATYLSVMSKKLIKGYIEDDDCLMFYGPFNTL